MTDSMNDGLGDGTGDGLGDGLLEMTDGPVCGGAETDIHYYGSHERRRTAKCTSQLLRHVYSQHVHMEKIQIAR